MGRTMDEAERTLRALRSDERADREEAEAAVAELARSQRSLRDAVLDLARSGAPVRVELSTAVVAGRVVHVGDALVRVVNGQGDVVDVALDASMAVVFEGGRHLPATVTTGYPATLLARCRELVQANAAVEIGRRGGTVLVGALVAATSTHLELDGGDGEVVLVPLAEVASVARRRR